MANNDKPPERIAGVEVIPFILTFEGALTVPLGTPHEMVKASVASQVNVSASLLSALTKWQVDTTSKLTIAKG